MRRALAFLAAPAVMAATWVAVRAADRRVCRWAEDTGGDDA
jgi:hypothetical protein